MEKLAAVLGHSSTEVTRRYAHLRPQDGAAVVPTPKAGAVGQKDGQRGGRGRWTGDGFRV